jgi:hypothetical protein
MLTDDWKSIRTDVVLDHPEYKASLEEFRDSSGRQMVFVHLYVFAPWTKALLQRFRSEWTLFRKHVTCPLFACADVDDEKWAKFVSLFGFKPLSEAICTDGKRRRIFWHQGNGTVLTNN